MNGLGLEDGRIRVGPWNRVHAKRLRSRRNNHLAEGGGSVYQYGIDMVWGGGVGKVLNILSDLPPPTTMDYPQISIDFSTVCFHTWIVYGS